MIITNIMSSFPENATINIEEKVNQGDAQGILTYVENAVKALPEMDDIIRKEDKKRDGKGKSFADVVEKLREICKDP